MAKRSVACRHEPLDCLLRELTAGPDDLLDLLDQLLKGLAVVHGIDRCAGSWASESTLSNGNASP